MGKNTDNYQFIQIITNLKISNNIDKNNQEIIIKNIIKKIFTLINPENANQLDFGSKLDDYIRIIKVEAKIIDNNNANK